MKTIIAMVLLIAATNTKAQTFLPGSLLNNPYRTSLANNRYLTDSSFKKKWSLSRYSSVATTYSFFKGGNAFIVAAPLGLQLNRRLNNNLFAFAGVSVAPAYVSFNQSFVTTDMNKVNQGYSYFKGSNLGLYSRAEVGLQYVNDEKTFSISGSIGVERNSYPFIPYRPVNSKKSN